MDWITAQDYLGEELSSPVKQPRECTSPMRIFSLYFPAAVHSMSYAVYSSGPNRFLHTSRGGGDARVMSQTYGNSQSTVCDFGQTTINTVCLRGLAMLLVQRVA